MDQDLRDLEFTIRIVLRGLTGHPSRRGRPLMDEARASTVAGELLEAMARAGYTITDRTGQVVVQGGPEGESVTAGGKS